VLAIDHIVFPVTDLALAAADFGVRYGLASIEGGRHPTWGTANRIVPLGDAYIELVAVENPITAAQAAFGTWVATATPGQPLGWAVRTDAIEAVGRRLGLPIVAGSRATPGGELITWRSAGVDVATRERGLPFFIQWGDGVALPGATTVRHPGGPARVKRVSVTADPSRLDDWLGEHDLPISVSPSPTRGLAVVLSQGRRDYELASWAVE
jgi:hypothetical protein